MASEVQVRFTSGKTLYFQVRNATGSIWNTSTSAFEAYATGTIGNYSTSTTEQGTASGYYTGTFPTSISSGVYQVIIFERIGGSVAETDPTVGFNSDFNWSGTAHIGVANYLPARVTKNAALNNFSFMMVLSSDGTTAATGKTVAGQVSLDGGAFANLTNSVSEIGSGWYKVNLAAADTNGNIIALRFTNADCLTRNITIVTQPA